MRIVRSFNKPLAGANISDDAKYISARQSDIRILCCGDIIMSRHGMPSPNASFNSLTGRRFCSVANRCADTFLRPIHLIACTPLSLVTTRSPIAKSSTARGPCGVSIRLPREKQKISNETSLTPTVPDVDPGVLLWTTVKDAIGASKLTVTLSAALTPSKLVEVFPVARIV